MSAEDDEYYSQSRPEMLRFIPPTTRRLLDIGCSEGRFGEAVKRAIPECETWGVEPVSEVAAAAATRNDKVINASIGAVADLPQGYFDVVTMNDVLEHIDYSEPVLASIKSLLAPGGRLVLSLPNVRFYLNMRDLIFHKDWEYKDYGILDRTHLRFFTQKSAARLLRQNGYEVLETTGINERRAKLHYRLLFALAPSFFEDMKAGQFAIVAAPAN
jgi:2-polyprenyl-3-methyl-5-hydroxy-6-metoxy-1,4-benzoquinol methylase